MAKESAPGRAVMAQRKWFCRRRVAGGQGWKIYIGRVKFKIPDKSIASETGGQGSVKSYEELGI